MNSTTKSNMQKWLSVGAALLFLGFASSCSKKLMPPEIESTGGQQMSDAGGSSGGISESGFAESAGAGGDGTAGGDAGTGFNIQEQSESGPGGFFVEENVGDGSGTAGSGADFSTGSGRDFGTGSGGDIGNGSDGFFASKGGNGSGTGANGDGADGHGSFGSGSQEARLQNFQESGDLSDIHFAFDKYDLTDESKQTLRQNAEWLRSNPGTRIEIQGHCDERGTNNYNLGLGERRAISTKKFLVALGVDENRIFTISYGEEKPFCFESNENCWGKNRRAHFMVAQ